MSKFRIWMILVVLSFYALFPFNSFAIVENVSAAEANLPIKVKEGVDRIHISSNQYEDPEQNVEIFWEKKMGNVYLKVGDSLSILENLMIMENNRVIGPSTVKDHITIDVQNSNVVQIEENLKLKALGLGEAKVTVKYKESSVSFNLYIVEQLNRILTVTLPSDLGEYLDTEVYGYDQDNGMNYIHTETMETDIPNQLELSIPLDEFHYNEYRAVINTVGANYIVEFSGQMEQEITVDGNEYSQLTFPDFEYQSVEMIEHNSSLYMYGILSDNNTLIVPKGNYNISATYINEQGNESLNEYMFVTTDLKVEADTEVQFPKPIDYIPFTVNYLGEADYLGGDFYTNTDHFTLSENFGENDVFYTRPDLYNFNIWFDRKSYHFSLTKEEVDLTEPKNLTISTEFETMLELEAEYVGGEYIQLHDGNLSFQNEEGFSLRNIYNYDLRQEVKPILTLVNTENQEEIYTYILENMNISEIKLPYTEGTFDVIVSLDWNPSDPETATLVSLNTIQNLSLEKDETSNLTVVANYSNGSSKNVTANVSYTVDNPQILQVSNNGEVKGLTAGTAIINIQYLDRETQVTVQVTDSGEENLLTSITTNQESYSIEVEEEVPITVTAHFEGGNPEEVTNEANFITSDDTIVKIENGEIIGVGPGQATITVKYAGKTVQVNVTVKEPEEPENPVTSITAGQESYSIQVEEEVTLAVTAHYENGEEENVTSKASLTSSDSSVAGMKNGKIIGVGEGSATITIEYGGKSTQITVTVKQPENPLVSITVGQDSYSIQVEEEVTLAVTAKYENGEEENVTGKASLTSSDSSIAKMENGKIIGVGEGSATISIEYGGKSTQTTVTVKQPENPLTSITMGKETYSIQVEEAVTLSVTAKYENGEEENVTGKASLNTSDSSVARIENGKIIGVGAGQATITVTYEGKSVQITVRVTKSEDPVEPEVTLVKLTMNQELYEVTHFDQASYQVTAHYSNHSTKDITGEAKIISGNPNLIEIKNGKIKGLNTGTTKVTVSYLNKSVQVDVKVIPYLLKLQSTTKNFEIEKGQSIPLTVEAVYSDKTKNDVTSLATYKSSDQSIATVAANGHVTGVEEGQVTVTATYEGKKLEFNGSVLSDETGFEITVKDSNTNSAISDAKVMLQLYGATEFKAITQKSNGYFKEELEPGLYDVFIYKQGYMPVKEQVLVEKGHMSNKEILLERSDLIKAEFDATRMDESDMLEVGIDPNNPDNRWTFKFEAHLAFGGENHHIIFYGNSKGTLFGEPWGLGGGYYLYPFLIPTGDGHLEEGTIPLFAYMIIPGEVSWLKEYFKAQLSIQNLASEPFSIKNSKISLQLPDGLSLADTFESQGLEINIGDLAGGETLYQEWYIRGDQKGEYHLKATFDGSLFPFNERVHGEFVTKNPIKVWGDDALKMFIGAEGRSQAGMPYKVQIRLQNVSDAPIYYLNFSLLEEGKKNFFYSPKTQFEYSVNQLAAGEEIVFHYLLIPRISGTLDLAHSFVLKTGGNAQVETIIESIED